MYRKDNKYEGNNYIHVPVKGETVPWRSFIQWINTNIHRILSKAPFDPKAKNLRKDGLACLNCPERTGAIASLFEPNPVGKQDACLNPACYVQKAQALVQVRRRELAELRKIEPIAVPIIRSWCYTNGKDYLGTESATVISGAKRGGNAKNCDNAVSGIDIEAENYGQTVKVCLKSSRCKIHWPEAKAASTAKSLKAMSEEDQAAARLEAHRVRREEIWNAKVAEAVRIRVFKQAAEKFEKKFRVTDVGTDFLPQLIARFWSMTSSGDRNNLHDVVQYLVNEWGTKPGSSNGKSTSADWSAIEVQKKLERAMHFRLLFLLIHAHKGTIGYGNTYRSQSDVKSLAAEFTVDYRLIDAEVRLELSSKKHKEVHEEYLAGVREKSEETNIPHPFSEKWKASD